MLRRLFTLLSALSLLLCVAVGVLWVRSYFIGDQLLWESSHGWGSHIRTDKSFAVQDEDGSVRLLSSTRIWSGPGVEILPTDDGRTTFRHRTTADGPGRPILTMAPHEPRSMWNSLGIYSDSFSYVMTLRPPNTGTLTGWSVTIPLWIPTILAGGLPTVWLLRWRRRTRNAAVGLCPTCGYDLRATPGRCPECGAVPAGVKG